MAPNTFVPTRNTGTWNAIVNRLAKITPTIVIADYVDFGVPNAIEVLDYPSQGINFVLAKHQRQAFLDLLRDAKAVRNKKAFESGRWQGALHAAKGLLKDAATSVTGRSNDDSWALNISFKATKGFGYREIWYPDLTERQERLLQARALRVDTPTFDPAFTSMFHAPRSGLDLRSLHWAVGDADAATGRSACNVHIDQVTVLADLGDGAGLTPDFPYHYLVELLFRTNLKGLVPDAVLQAVDFVMPNSHENYAMNFGVEITPINRKNLRLSLRGMCSVHNDGCQWSGAINLTGTHDLLGSK